MLNMKRFACLSRGLLLFALMVLPALAVDAQEQEEQPEQLPDELPERSYGDLTTRKARTVKDKAQGAAQAQDLEEEL